MLKKLKLDDYVFWRQWALILATICFILGIISKLGGFILVASPRSFIALAIVGLLFAVNLSLLQHLRAREEVAEAPPGVPGEAAEGVPAEEEPSEVPSEARPEAPTESPPEAPPES